MTGEPSGLTVTLPKALAELRKAAGPGARIMLGFDRGGAYPQVFTHCRDQQVHWVTYRRAPLAVPAMLPVITTVTYGGRTRQIAWAEETVQLKDYGEARQITLFEHGKVALQILTSDFEACPAEILSWLKSRWREENFLKYASENYGIDKICDYLARSTTNTKLIRNPAREQANAAVRERGEDPRRRRDATWPGCSPDPAITPAAKNARIPALQKKITRARTDLAAAAAARKTDPRETARQRHRPRREDRAAARRAPRPADGPAAARAQRRALALEPPQRLPPRRRRIPRHHPPDHHPRPGRHHHLHPRRDHRHPRTARRPRIARALALLIDEINATPPAMPGDTRPITYQITPHPAFNSKRTPFAGDLSPSAPRTEHKRVQITPRGRRVRQGTRGHADRSRYGE